MLFPKTPVTDDARIAIFTRLRAENPEPTTELDFGTPFELLIAVMLSAQATDVGVNKATARLFPAARTPAAMVALGPDRLKDFIRTIGLFNTKAENILKTCRILLDEHGGEVPRRREALDALPGVGRKTANVVLNTAFGEPTIAVDTHIFRVCNRTGRRSRPHAPAGGGRPATLGARRLQARRSPLADPARPLRVHGAQTPLRRVRYRGSVQVRREDGTRVKRRAVARDGLKWLRHGCSFFGPADRLGPREVHELADRDPPCAPHLEDVQRIPGGTFIEPCVT